MRADWLVDVTPGTIGTAKVERFEVTQQDYYGLIHGRHCPKGVYTRLVVNGALWMSDTPAEQRDHWEPVYQAQQRGGRVLVMGLGLGLVVKQFLAMPNVEHVDVVEINPDVIALVGPHYACDRLTIHEADAYAIKWPVGTRWSVVWHDIWLNLCEDNLAEIARLKRSYGRRADWQGAWGQGEILRDQRRYGSW
jgi:hypothetical protein